MEFLEEIPDLIIPYEDIERTTEDFSKIIGRGRHGVVYHGELLISGKLTRVAVKQLDGNISSQGLEEFLKHEIKLLSGYRHPNLVFLSGVSLSDSAKIIIHEYAEHRSLETYISKGKPTIPLTWEQQIKICIDAARGLDYLHSHAEENLRVIHMGIKSANILLDQNWKAMIADAGLTKIGHTDDIKTYHTANASGYCDPTYADSGILTKNSDVYSFGVVLFEVLCQRLSFIDVNDERRFLAPMAKRYYEKEKLNDIIDPDLKLQMKSSSLQTFSGIAYQCLHNDPGQRPSMCLVVQKLQEALEFQMQEVSYVEVGPWGGTGGSRWTFQPNGRITGIHIACGRCVDSIMFSYTDEDQVKHNSDRYGGGTGVAQTINFAEDEEIIGIKGTYGEYGPVTVIRALSFHTNKETYGSFGKKEGTSFSIPLTKGKFIGFSGNCGSYLDSFGAIIQPY